MARTAMKKAKPDVYISQEAGGKLWKMKFVSLMTQEISFELDKEFMNKVYKFLHGSLPSSKPHFIIL